jgi:serine/threonine-protein kinase
MAVVYLAVTRGAEGFTRAFVVKRLRPEMLANPASVTQFIDEARLGSSLVHGNIIPVFDFGRDAEGYYLAQEYILGRDLDTLINASLAWRNQALELPHVLYVAQEALQALAYAHTHHNANGEAAGLVHRDVSPNNLMISAQGEVKLLDLGIAKSNDNLTKTQDGMIKGNVFYMSPEQARALPVDGRADLFSLGLVLYTAYKGIPLYQGATNYELIQRAGAGLGPNEWTRIEALPAPLAKLLTRALQFDPAQRFATARDFADAIPKELIGPASEMHALMQKMFADAFREETAMLQPSGKPA